MGLVDKLKDQFLDVIEFEDVSNKLVVYKFKRNEPNNEIKQGSKVIVREGQKAAFVKGGKLADIMNPGTYTLNKIFRFYHHYKHFLLCLLHQLYQTYIL